MATREVMSADDIRRAITRIGHEIVERNHGTQRVMLVGLQRGGVWIAERLADTLTRIEGRLDGSGPIGFGTLDVSMYRDDIGLRPIIPASVTDLPDGIDGYDVVLVDDVLFTGRTVKAALDAIGDHGRPRSVQLAVIVDRGHRELPIRPDYVGKNLPTARSEDVSVTGEGVTLT